MTLSRDTFGHDEEIGRLFEEYDRLVRWEEHDSRLDATDPVIERAVVRGRIVAFIANTATLQQDAHTSIAEPEPQDVEEARECDNCEEEVDAGDLWKWHPPLSTEPDEVIELCRACFRGAIADERTRWAERERLLVEALERAFRLTAMWRDVTDETLGRLTSSGSATLDFMHDEMDELTAIATPARAALGEERTTDAD